MWSSAAALDGLGGGLRRRRLNGQIADKLDALVRTPFFRLYKTSLYRGALD